MILTPYKTIDYLAIGHISLDMNKNGKTAIGGTVSYSGLTAQQMGVRVGIVTSGNFDKPPVELTGIQTCIHKSAHNTIFENIISTEGRIQYLHNKASDITEEMIPVEWKSTPIIHLGPLINEMEPELCLAFPDALVALTPQGWMRGVNGENKITRIPWEINQSVLQTVDCIIFSTEDVNYNEAIIDSLIPECKILVVTESSTGARVYWNGNLKYFRAPKQSEIDPTGAGDIFASSFLIRYHETNDPWIAGKFATQIASNSVKRRGLNSIPTQKEIQKALQEVI